MENAPPPFSPSPRAGRLEMTKAGGETVRAFVPAPLPPHPPIRLDAQLQDILERANLAVGRLDGVATLLPEADLFLYSYIRKEAVLSSQIEGTQSSLSELLLYESAGAPGALIDEVKEVSRYVAAMDHGLKRMAEGFPLSLRLMREMHAILLKGARGADKEPGEFRRSQNWIGGSRPGNARYVPPPAHEVLPAMGALEKFIHDKPHRVSPLLKAGLAHVQFESIHPFLDGNGRLGRLLIALVLANDKVLARPLLYLSLYFKENREAYYEKLQDVRRNGNWENWLVFYLTGVAEVADQAALTVRRASALFAKHREKIRSLGRAGFTAERVHGLLERRVVSTASRAAKELRLSFPAAAKALRNLKAIGVTREITGKGPAKIYVYQPYLDILTQGTENPF